jgi:transketolase
MDNSELTESCARIRRMILDIVVAAGKGHVGGSLSAVEILVALYHGGVLRVDAAKPLAPGRDRFIMSKGHACEALYAVLADRGFFPAAELPRLGRDGSMLGGHPDRRVPGVEADTGSLGNGLGVGAGMAFAAKLDQAAWRTYALLGDGECYEGSVWEALMFAAHHALDNLTAIIDRNQLCVLDRTEDCNRLEPLDDKLRAFGWDVAAVDGHDVAALLAALSAPRRGKPLAVIANTVKGKGVSFMENDMRWHHGLPKGELLKQARQELGCGGAL